MFSHRFVSDWDQLIRAGGNRWTELNLTRLCPSGSFSQSENNISVSIYLHVLSVCAQLCIMVVCVCVQGKGWERVAGGDGCAALTLNFKAKLVCLLFTSSAGFPADNVSLMFISSLNYSNPAQVLGSLALSLEYICCFHNKSLYWCKAAFTPHGIVSFSNITSC